MSSWHIGLSVVATDVGVVLNWFRRTRFYNGISGSWMLFTGLLGAWLVQYF
jgi:SSS family solute:Na+ symporter